MSTSSDVSSENDGSKKRRGGSQKKSWVWDWFIKSGEMGVTCQVENAEGQLCGQCYKNASSTGNLITHLNNKHQITEGMKKQDFVVCNNFFF